jgi:glycerate-2-kinase
MRIKNTGKLNGHGNTEGRRVMTELLEAGLEAADPAINAGKLLKREGSMQYIGSEAFEPIGSPPTGVDVYDLKSDIDRIYVFGAGKGIWRAIQAIEDILGEYLTGGHVILKYGDEGSSEKIGITRAAHPVPDENCILGCQRMKDCIGQAELADRDLVSTGIGNGVSSLMTFPPRGVALEDVKRCTHVIQIERGFSTPELNMVRNQLDLFKGGRITRFLHPAKMVHIMTVDVNVRNAYNVEGYQALMETNSWLHTLPDMTRPAVAMDFLKNHDLWDSMAASVRDYLENRGEENPVLTKEESSKKWTAASSG